jgi:hypothetical protein
MVSNQKKEVTKSSVNNHLVSKPKQPQNLRTHLYVRGTPYGHLRGAMKSLKTAKPLKQLNNTVDTFGPLTVNSSAVRLVNTLADKANGADSRR